MSTIVTNSPKILKDPAIEDLDPDRISKDVPQLIASIRKALT